MIANGRISDRSFRRYRWVTMLHASDAPLASLCFGMQSQEDARRAIALGAPPERVVVTGSMKTDAVADLPGVRRALGAAARARGADERLWVAGSTHRGEDEIVLDVFARLRARRHRGLVLLLAPRHPERVPEVERAPPRARPGRRAPDAGCPRRGPRACRSSCSTRWASSPRSTGWPRWSSSGGSLVPDGGA